MNDDPEFDPLVTEALGHYVYALFDPDTGLPFYVGKGGGREAQGNKRVLAHLREARQKHRSEGPLSEKIKTIHGIWDKGKPVDWKIIRRGLASEQEALMVEAALIDAYRAAKINVANEQSGHGQLENGLLEKDDVYALAAPPFDAEKLPLSLINRPIFLFNIDAGFRERQNYRDATVGHWAMRRSLANICHAVLIGASGKVSRCAVGSKSWLPSKVVPNRFEAEAHDLTDEETKALIHRNMAPIINRCIGFWKFGGFLVFHVDHNGETHFSRGKRSSERGPRLGVGIT